MLFFLGRRIERLFFIGAFVTFLCVVEAYVTTANRVLAEDRSTAGISELLSRIQAQEQSLADLFQMKQTPPAKAAEDLARLTERVQLIAQARKSLGLPPIQLAADKADGKEAKTYAKALSAIVFEVAEKTRSPKDLLQMFDDANKSPTEIIGILDSLRIQMSAKPASVWGISTPRVIQLQYAG